MILVLDSCSECVKHVEGKYTFSKKENKNLTTGPDANKCLEKKILACNSTHAQAVLNNYLIK